MWLFPQHRLNAIGHDLVGVGSAVNGMADIGSSPSASLLINELSTTQELAPVPRARRNRLSKNKESTFTNTLFLRARKCNLL